MQEARQVHQSARTTRANGGMIGGMTMIANRRNRMGMRLATVNYSVAAPPIENPTAFAVGFFLPEWSVLARFHSALPWGVDDDFDQFWAEAGLVTRHEQ